MISFKQYMSQPHIQLEMTKYFEMAWDDSISSKQQGFIKSLTGVWPSDGLNRRQASEIIDAAKSGNVDKAIELTNTPVKEPQQPQSQQQSQPQEDQKAVWILATAKMQLGAIKPGTHVVMTKMPNNNWSMMDRNAKTKEIPTEQLKDSIESVRDSNGKPFQDIDPEKLFSMVPEDTPPKLRDDSNKKTGIIPNLSEEQEKIDNQFKEILNHPSQEQSHLVINADPGSGKTTMLNHLAWKYGKPGQKWLYLVFNKKNEVEATDKFPSFVEVKTTNAFLGNLLSHSSNLSNIPQTTRVVQALRGEGKRMPEKIRFIADGNEFGKELEKHKIPTVYKGQLDCCGANKFIEEDYDKYQLNTLVSILKRISASFKENCIALTEMSKNYALDPRTKKEDLVENIKKVMKSHDNIDPQLLEIRERIGKYKEGAFKDDLLDNLEQLLGYDITNKDFTDEMIESSVWMLNKSMPHATDQSHNDKGKEHDLGKLRDFSDDAWFAVTHADDLKWPKYDVVLADEIQDFNEARKIMLKKLHDAGSRSIIAVGDSKQSLYRFIGADSKAIENLSTMLGDLSHNKDVEHTLTKNFRSRPEVLDLVEKETGKKLNQGKSFKDGKGAGTKDKIKYEDAFHKLEEEKEDGKIKETAMISRTNGPLVHAALKLLGKAVPFIIVGKDIAKELMRHISMIINKSKYGNSIETVEDLHHEIQQHAEKEHEAHLGRSSKKAALKELKETTEALVATIEQFSDEGKGNSIKDFKNWLGDKLGGLDIEKSEKDYRAYKEKIEKENPVILTTSHKSKGLEFSRVYILRYDQFPHPKAKSDEDLQQEENAKFVALTRGQDEVHILDVKGQPGVKEEEEG
jgi:superfamily I DNA/RNA helicase